MSRPAYTKGHGPVVNVDEGHSNFHTIEGRYKPFARLLAADGYVVKPFTGRFTSASLGPVRILVIANALNPKNTSRWTVPILPAFTREEVLAVRNWVNKGGNLLLIADHMPFPGAAAGLAKAFGVRFTNGFAMHKKRIGRPGPLLFRRTDGTSAKGAPTDGAKARGTPADGTLADHVVTNGRNPDERVDSVATFTGQAFTAPPNARSLLTFGPDVVSLMPRTAWKFTRSTPRAAVAGWLQAAVMHFGKGRAAFFGEAAMFSAQTTGARRRPVGMNAPAAGQNPRLLLNLFHWLSGLLDPQARNHAG